MIERLTEGFAWAKRFEDQGGQSLVEFAFCLATLIPLLFGVIDFSQMILDEHILVGLSRQGSNIASRTTDLPSALAAVVSQGASLDIADRGEIIVTEVRNSGNNVKGTAQVIDQTQTPTSISPAPVSVVGSVIGKAATMPPGAVAALDAGETLYVTEVFYSYKPLTPVGAFLKQSLAFTMSQAAYF